MRDAARERLARSDDRGRRILLVIVARRDQALCDYLARRLAGVEGVRVILDRRQGQRRQERQPQAPERRRGRERRTGRHEQRFLGYTFVRLP